MGDCAGIRSPLFPLLLLFQFSLRRELNLRKSLRRFPKSICLTEVRQMDSSGFEPEASRLQSGRSTVELRARSAFLSGDFRYM